MTTESTFDAALDAWKSAEIQPQLLGRFELFEAGYCAGSAMAGAQNRRPLTDAQITSGMDVGVISAALQEAFGAGVRFAERRHRVLGPNVKVNRPVVA